MAEGFGKSVEDGLRLSKRIYFGKDRAVAPPKPLPLMDKSWDAYLPTSPMVYAVIPDPGIVDNPDIPSYQPHVHGRCDPPALIPLHMNRIELEADCYLDSVLVCVSGSWRVHCVMGSKCCDCRIAVPMGEQGSILGVEVDVHRKSYCTELIAVDDKNHMEKEVKLEHGGFLKPHIFTLTVPNVDGGSTLSIKISWIQKLSYHEGEFSVLVPFSFPEYVTPTSKKIPRKEKIQLSVNSCAATEIICRGTSHPFKEARREAGKLRLLYETEVLTWTNADLTVSYSVSLVQIFGAVLLQSPSPQDVDQREMFCAYLFPGPERGRKVFRREIVFVVDISGSMDGKPLDSTKNTITATLTKLDSKDSFNIIAFNEETHLFSTSMELATEQTVKKAIQWITENFVAAGSTNIMAPLLQAIEMVSKTHGSMPVIFLVTDGSVHDERHICDLMKSNLTGREPITPRIYTFGIGSYCNHYFLRMLATISRGQHSAAYNVDSVEPQMHKLLSKALSAVLANISFDTLDGLIEVEIYPFLIPDLTSESPLTISGRYQGDFPQTLKARGVLGNLSEYVIDLKIQNVKDIPLDKICARQQIDLLTAQAWFSDDKQLEEKIAKTSIQTGFVSEYTCLTLIEGENVNQDTQSALPHKLLHKGDSRKVDPQSRRRIAMQNICVGFGNLTATADNIPSGVDEPRLPEAAEMLIKAASNCCGKIFDQCCCMCCIQCCSRINNQCAIALTQLCTALACFSCFELCGEVCCSGDDGH